MNAYEYVRNYCLENDSCRTLYALDNPLNDNGDLNKDVTIEQLHDIYLSNKGDYAALLKEIFPYMDLKGFAEKSLNGDKAANNVPYRFYAAQFLNICGIICRRFVAAGLEKYDISNIGDGSKTISEYFIDDCNCYNAKIVNF